MRIGSQSFIRPAVLALALTVGLDASAANAQFFWGSSSRNTIADRQVVAFPKVYKPGEIIVSFADRRLYNVVAPGKAISYPVAAPRPQSRWQGVLRISRKVVDPVWTPTPEMRRENPSLPAFVPGGHPRNPLGRRALYLGNTLYRIHGTDAPWTIGKAVSRGCIRMHNPHVAELFSRTKVGAKVTVTWQRFDVAALASGDGPYRATTSSSAYRADGAGLHMNWRAERLQNYLR